MAWKDLISGSFGFGTAPFAAYEPDTDFADRAIKEAQEEGATREEFAQEIAEYRRRHYAKIDRVLRDGITADSATLDKLWKVSRYAA
jgi:hypothetical protein